MLIRYRGWEEFHSFFFCRFPNGKRYFFVDLRILLVQGVKSLEIALNLIITKLIQKRASDMYLLPAEHDYRLLANIEGKLCLLQRMASDQATKWIANLKYQANMAISEHRRPQAGALQWTDGEHVDVRLSTVGDYNGRESLVARFIYRLSREGYSLLIPEQWKQLESAISRRGMVLFAGPTGSGKTTTMYRLATSFRKGVVMAIEDPVEIREPAFLQLQVNRLAGMDYQDLLRVGLRHRPQVFIIGEIRDSETAQMAIQAALSGHLVLATVHARSAYGVVARLQQLGIEQYYLDQTLSGVCYQRLIPDKEGNLAVLFDLLNGNNLRQAVRTGGSGGITDEWQQNLTNAVSKGQISKEVAAQFQNG